MVIDAVEQEGLPSSEWSPFNMRQYNLSILKPPVGKSSAMGSSTTTTNTTSSSNNNKASSMSYTSAAKSLDLLRQNLQRSINQEIKSVITKYIDLFAKPGIENIKNNLGPDSVTEDHIHNMCRQILEEAKRMYPVYSSSSPSSNSAIDPNDSDYQSSQNNSSTGDGVRLPLTSPMGIKRESDTDSEASSMSNASKKLKKSANNNKSGAGNPGGNNSTNNNNAGSPNKPKKPAGPSRKHVASWDGNKLTVETLFIMGAKANKALGFAQTRGRLYVKHPGLFKYASDSDDKEWLSKNKLMPATGGRAYIMLLEDIEKLAKDNKLNATINYDDIKGFRVPDFILTKMKSYIDSWKKQYAEEPKSASTTTTTTTATTVSAKNRNHQNNHNGNHHQQQQQQHPTPPPQHHPPPPVQQQQQQMHHQIPMTSMGGSNGTLTQLNPPPPPQTLSLHSQGPPMQQQQAQQQQLSHSQANLSSYHMSGSSPGNIMYEPSLMPLNSAPPPQSHDLAEYNIHMEKPPPMYPGHSNPQQQGPPQQQQPPPPPPPPQQQQQQPHAMSQMQNPNPVAYQVHPPPNHLDPIEQALSKGDWSNVSDRSLLQYALQSSRNMGSWDPQDSFDLIDSVTNGSLVGGGNMVVGENSPLLQISGDGGAHLTAPPMGPVSPNCELSAVLDQAFQYTDT